MSVDRIAEKLLRSERIDATEAKLLWEQAPLWLLARLASEAKVRKSGDKVFYNKNFHLEPTNICLFECRFCSYRRRKGEVGAWDYSMEEILEQVVSRKESGATEIHIVGGVHPERDIYYYAEMIRRIKEIMPEVCVKAFTAVELHYMIRKAGLSIEEGLQLLKEAGMESIPGGDSCRDLPGQVLFGGVVGDAREGAQVGLRLECYDVVWSYREHRASYRPSSPSA